MAIAFDAIGAKAVTGTTTVDVAYPSGVTAGEMLVVVRVSWPSSTSAITHATPSGWTQLVSGTSGSGSGAGAADSHRTHVSIDIKEAVGGESGTVQFSQSNVAGVTAVMLSYTKGAGMAWEWAGTGTTVSGDTSHGTGRAGTTSGSMSFKTGDLILGGVSVDTDVALSPTSPIMNFTNQFGTINRRTSGAGSATGNNGNVEVYDRVLTGPNTETTSGAAFGWTLTTNQCGAAGWIRLREVAGAMEEKSGTGTLSQTHTVVSTGNRSTSGTGSISSAEPELTGSGDAVGAGGTRIIRDATDAPGNGTVLTSGNVPAQSVIGSPTFFDDGTRWWYRYNPASGGQQSYRLPVTNSKTQAWRGRLFVPTTAPTINRVVMVARYTSSGNAFRISMDSSRRLLLVMGASPFTTIATIPTTLTAGAEYDVAMEYVVGTTGSGVTGDSTYTVTILEPSTDTVIDSISGTTNLGTGTITHYDVGSNDTAATAIDFRWTNLQFENDRTTMLPVYDQVGGEPEVPEGDFDIVVGLIQSNMRGRADDFDYPTTDFYRPGVYQWNPLTDTVIEAIEPAPVFEATPYMGPMNRFSRSYVDDGRLTAGRSLLLVNLAEGGTGVSLPDSNSGNETWWPSETATKTDLYARALAELEAVFAAVGTGSKVVAVLANHGSTDGTNNLPAATFTARATEVIEGIQAFLLAEGMTDNPKTPYVMMQMRPSLLAENRHLIIDNAQKDMVSLPGVRYVLSPDGSEFNQPDSVHFNAAGVRLIGQNLYAAFDVDARGGTGAISQTSTITSTGTKAASGTAALSNTHTLTATSGKVGAGTAAISQTHAVVSTGVKAGSGTASLDQAHTLTATSGKIQSATGAISQSHTLLSTGEKQGSGTAVLSQTHTLLAVSGKLSQGTATLSATSTLTSTGTKSTSGTAALSQTSVLEATSGRVGSGAVAIDQVSTVTSTGTTSRSGTATLSQTHTLVAVSGRVSGSSGLIDQTHTVTSTGTTAKVGTAALSQTSTLTAISGKTQAGPVTISQSSDVTSTGIKSGSGTSSLLQTSTLAASSGKVSQGTGTISESSTVAAVGAKTGLGTGQVSQPSDAQSSGTRLAAGSGTVAQSSTITGSGIKVEGGQGAGQIEQVSELTSTGRKTAASGTAQITQTSTLLGTSGKVAAGTGILSHTLTLTNSGQKLGSGLGGISQSSTYTSSGSKTGLGVGGITQTSTLVGEGDAVESGSATGTIVQLVEVTSSGSRATSGSGSLVQTSVVSSTGSKTGSGSGSISSTPQVTGSGERVTDARSGTGQIFQSANLSSTGTKAASGAVGLSNTSTIASSGFKQGLGSGGINQPVAITVESFRQSFGFGSASQTSALTSAGSKQAGGLGAITVPVALLTSKGRQETIDSRDINCLFVLDGPRLDLDLDDGPRTGLILEGERFDFDLDPGLRFGFSLASDRYLFHLEMT